MNEIHIRRSPKRATHEITNDGQTVGTIAPNTRDGGYDISVTLGGHLPDFIESDVTVNVHSFTRAMRVARALAAIGREDARANIEEILPDACYRVEVAAEGDFPISLMVPNIESVDFMRRILTPVAVAAEGPVAIEQGPFLIDQPDTGDAETELAADMAAAD